MSVVDLAGRPVTGEIPDNRVALSLFKKLVADIESGELKIDSFYLITENAEQVHSYDSGITISEAISMLELEKFRILCMSEGVKL